MSHDIRGPISGIIGLTEVIKEHGSDSDKDLSNILELNELIQMSGQSVLELADEILGNNKEREHDEPGRDEFNLITFKEKLNRLYAPLALTKSIELKFELNQDNIELPFSKNKLLQITGNLISNAIKFTPEGGTVQIKLMLHRVRDGNKLMIEISDTGVGISDEQLTLIRKGERRSTHGTDGERGFGFGLPLVKHLVETSGGTMEIQSELGKGTKFNIELPR